MNAAVVFGVFHKSEEALNVAYMQTCLDLWGTCTSSCAAAIRHTLLEYALHYKTFTDRACPPPVTKAPQSILASSPQLPFPSLPPQSTSTPLLTSLPRPTLFRRRLEWKLRQ